MTRNSGDTDVTRPSPSRKPGLPGLRQVEHNGCTYTRYFVSRERRMRSLKLEPGPRAGQRKSVECRTDNGSVSLLKNALIPAVALFSPSRHGGIAVSGDVRQSLVFALSDGGGARHPVSPSSVVAAGSSVLAQVHPPRRSRVRSGGSNSGCWTRGRGFSCGRTADREDAPSPPPR